MKRRKNKAEKKSIGKKLIEKAELAMKHEFYLEASLIMSSIMEIRLKKLLGQFENQLPGPGFTLEQSIKRVKHLHVSAKHPELTEHFRIGLIDEIRNWKNQRNEALKDIPDIHVSDARLERLAVEGKRLLKEWKKAAKAFNAAKS
jgi:hypothetical protein